MSVVQNSGVSAIQRFLMCLKSMVKQLGVSDQKCLRYRVSATEGCPLSGVPL